MEDQNLYFSLKHEAFDENLYYAYLIFKALLEINYEKLSSREKIEKFMEVLTRVNEV